MAEYYPLLAKAVGSLPNSTLETRRVVYERARKALIGQLRTLHPPVPDDDIERESTALDRAIERLEGELAATPPAGPVAPAPVPAPPAAAPDPSAEKTPKAPLRTKVPLAKPAKPAAPAADTAAKAPVAPVELKAAPKQVEPKPVETKPAEAKATEAKTTAIKPVDAKPVALEPVAPKLPEAKPVEPKSVEPARPDAAPVDAGATARDETKPLKLPGGKAKADGQRPFAPQPVSVEASKRRRWVIPLLGIAFVMLLVGVAAWKLRDHPQTVARTKAVEPQSQAETGKIVERVGEPGQPPADTSPAEPAAPTTPTRPTTTAQQPAATAPAANNPEVPVAHRAALLVEAPDEPSKVKTFLGTVVWKLNNVSGGPNDAVGLAVEADIDLPDDKLSAVVIFEKNTDSSLPASHTIKIRFTVQSSSATGDIKQIDVPQLRQEDSPKAEPLAGVTVPVIPNSFLVGLSPGNAESANLELLRTLQWIDIPMLLNSGKIAKLTFEKSDSGQRDLTEAIAAWQK